MNAKELIDAGVKVGDNIYQCYSGYKVSCFVVINITTKLEDTRVNRIVVQDVDNCYRVFVITDTSTETYALTKHQAVDNWINTLHNWIAEAEKFKASLK